MYSNLLIFLRIAKSQHLVQQSLYNLCALHVMTAEVPVLVSNTVWQRCSEYIAVLENAVAFSI